MAATAALTTMMPIASAESIGFSYSSNTSYSTTSGSSASSGNSASYGLSWDNGDGSWTSESTNSSNSENFQFRGDANKDSKITIADAKKILNVIRDGKENEQIDNFIGFDYNNDGRISVADARKIVSDISKNKVPTLSSQSQGTSVSLPQ